MTYPSKQRKQSKLSKKNKIKVRKNNKTKVRKNKRTRRFRKQYGGKLNDQQIKYIQEQIKDLGFSDEERSQLNMFFNKISQHLSKQILENQTVLDAFFDNVNENYRRRPNLTPEQKRNVFLGLLSNMYRRFSEKEPDTDDEDDD